MATTAIWVCGSGARSAALARALARAARVHRSTLPAAGLTTAAATAASDRQVAEAWRSLGSVDAVVIHPSVSTAPVRRNPGLSAWKRGINGTLRASFLLGRAAGAALERQGRGALIVVIESAAAADAIGAVAGDGLSCLVDALGAALSADLRVGEIRVGSRRTAPAAVARSVLHAVDGAPSGPLPNVRSGAGSRG